MINRDFKQLKLKNLFYGMQNCEIKFSILAKKMFLKIEKNYSDIQNC